jgi:hypothetical protein
MRKSNFTVILFAAVAAGAAVSSAALIHFTGTAGAERSTPTKQMRVHAQETTSGTTHGTAGDAPSARNFARILAGSSNQYGQEHSTPQRIQRVHCVPGSPGHYMCSYAVVQTGASSECHLIQASWTPDATSTYTVTLSGRTARCGTLRDAIDSLE